MTHNVELSCLPLNRTFIDKEQFQEYIEKGDSVFIFDSKVYKVNSFISKHPGGRDVLENALGRDATDEIRSMHPAKVYEKMIDPYYIGDYIYFVKPDLAKSIPKKSRNPDEQFVGMWKGGISIKACKDYLKKVNMAHYVKLSQDLTDRQNLSNIEVRNAYRRLEQKIKSKGLDKCNYWRYGEECCRCLSLLVLSFWFTLEGTTWWHFIIGAGFLAGFWHQIVFTAHDAGHNAITGKSEIDHPIGVITANFLCGLSLGWWKKSHNVHHIVTNHPEHDPDIQQLPFLAVTNRFFNNIYSTYYKRVLFFDETAKFFVKYQHYLYYLILSFGRFNLHRLSFVYLFTSKNVRNRKLELTGIAFFFIWFGALISYVPTWRLRIVYILVSYMLTFPLHVQATLSHFGMSTEDLGPNEPFPTKMLRTTMDVDCPLWLDWFHGGLQYQVMHHLFPRTPRHNLRACVPLVQQFCDEVGLNYHMYSFSSGNGIVIGALRAVADQVGLLDEVARYNSGIWSGEQPHKF